ncbi:hypothetical protein L484_013729 [Morus notabilis]|uniref:Uncharacterized protein n=1 Tax=Morus notabilis TaxID=981085 RepID=W9R7Y7_9ROSA|nr:hypothetical protein L484_013729 [Morus notabilis]
MALTFNGVIPQTRGLSNNSWGLFGSPSKKPSQTRFPTWVVSRPKTKPRFSHGTSSVSSSAAKTDSTLSDVEYREAQDHNNGFTPTSTSTTAWSEFARNVSGEWDGFGADFSKAGNPIELPEYVVPEAYREWEVKVFDWQTQCPTLAQPEEPVLMYKLIKLLPTVGCEADAATWYSIDERTVGGLDNRVSAFAYQSSGCYVAVWPMEEKGPLKLLELEHCLINPQDRESRMRIVQVVRLENEKIVLQGIRVFVEQWYGPFRNGDQLGGCSIRDSAFASTAALKASDVFGVWEGLNSVASFDGSQVDFLQQLQNGTIVKSVRDERDIVLLPKQLWCSVKECEDGETRCEAGWLLSHSHAITSKCTFSGKATLKARSFNSF